MLPRLPAGSRHRPSRPAAVLFALLFPLSGLPLAAGVIAAAPTPVQSAPSDRARKELLIARVFVNGMLKGDLPIARDGNGHILVPAAEFAGWGLAYPGAKPIDVKGDPFIDVSSLSGLEVKFDSATVTLHLQVAANALPGTSLDLGPRRGASVMYPAETSFFLNYGFNATGDDAFADRRYQFTTELAARSGNWLFYNTTNQVWDESGPQDGFTRLITNAQYDDRPNLRRLTVGDFFTPAFDLSGAVPMGGVSLTKYYSMDPYFVQYPTASFSTEVALPSTVVVRVDGNVVAQRQVQPGPLDIANITGVTGVQNVSVVIRDAFGREQLLQQPFFFATNAGLAAGLHEYSYNLGFIRREYGISSDDYGGLAASAFHRYAFSNALTLGLRGQAMRDLYNIGPFGTYQFPRFGLIAAGISVGGSGSSSGTAETLAYAYSGNNVSLNLGVRYFSRDYAQLSDLDAIFRSRNDQYASVSAFDATLGTLSATFTGSDRYAGPSSKVWNAGYTRSALAGKGLVSLTYTRTVEPASGSVWLLSFRYYFDSQTSMSANVGGTRQATTESISLDRSTPQGEGLGYSLTAGHVSGSGQDAGYGQGFVQINAEHIAVGANYSRTTAGGAGPSFSQLFVAGSIGAVGGSVFAGRPVLDSFAVIRIPELEDVPVYANGWFAGRTNGRGEVVATNLASYYDNYITFGTADLALDYTFDRIERVVSPPARSGTLISFPVRRSHAVFGTLVQIRDGKPMPLEFRDIRLTRVGATVAGFTARRGEFYLEGVEPGEYELRAYGEPACAARVVVREPTGTMSDVGVVTCEAIAR